MLTHTIRVCFLCLMPSSMNSTCEFLSMNKQWLSVHFQKFSLETTNTHTFTVKSNIQIVINTKYVLKTRKQMYQPCSIVLLSGLGSVGGGGAGGSSEQLPGERNSRTTLST